MSWKVVIFELINDFFNTNVEFDLVGHSSQKMQLWYRCSKNRTESNSKVMEDFLGFLVATHVPQSDEQIMNYVH
jgi:hypothetical protein